jgi:exodeoxyribonuclease V alpha subunit
MSARPTGHDPSGASRDLAEGLAEYLCQAARELGASEQSLRAVRRAVLALVAASERGQICIRLSDEFGDDAEGLRVALFGSKLMMTPEADRPLPLALDGQGRLYLYRYFDYERRLAAAIARLSASRCACALSAKARERLEAFFGGNKQGEPDWQRLAAALALTNPFTVISGGPGTGKTTTVVAILACLLEENPELDIVLAAPTGKAAAKMQEALRGRAAGLPDTLRSRLPNQSFTLHRLLGVIPGSGKFRHDANHPLALDVLIVDEASMLDLALATRLIEALPPGARLILLGDKHQLAAVEAGSVFGVLASNPALSPARLMAIATATGVPGDAVRPSSGDLSKPLADTTVWLRRSFRFHEDSAIGRLAAAIREATDSADGVLDALARKPEEAHLVDCAPGALPEALLARLVDAYTPYIDALGEDEADPRSLLEVFDTHRVLCALREGARGAGPINAEIARRLQRRLGVEPVRGSPWFFGRPVMITGNDYVLRLFNGDIGIALPDPRAGSRVWFPDPEAGVRGLPAVRLPEHETAFASTVHKAQGSEFNHASVILPSDPSPVLSRELVYTAVTRARKAVQIYGSREVLAAAILRPTDRTAGLSDRLVELA